MTQNGVVQSQRVGESKFTYITLFFPKVMQGCRQVGLLGETIPELGCHYGKDPLSGANSHAQPIVAPREGHPLPVIRLGS